MNGSGTIYGLIDPHSGLLRYVGMTIESLKERLRNHCRDHRKSHRTDWVKSIMRAGLKPLMKELLACPVEDLKDAEREMIAFFRSSGAILLNRTDGGDGNHTPESREKLRIARTGTKMSLESRLKMSESRRGRPRSLESRIRNGNAHRGMKRSPEARARMCLAQHDSRPSDFCRQRSAEVNRGKPQSVETKMRRSASLLAYNARRKAAQTNGVEEHERESVMVRT